MSFGRITKLNVHIAKCQTHITYANDATRLLTNNPSGFAFRSMGRTSYHCVGDPLTQASSFLRRHFVGVDIDMDEEPQQREQPEQVQVQQEVTEEETQAETQEDAQEESQQDIAEDIQEGDLEEEEPQTEPELHTWHLELLPKVLPQLATKTEYHVEHLEVSNCAWHLQNCVWRNVPNSEFQLPNCQCHRIKETMGHINQLVKTSMPEDEEEEDKEEGQQGPSKPTTRLMLDVNANIMSLNGLLQQLNELLEEQASLSSSI